MEKITTVLTVLILTGRLLETKEPDPWGDVAVATYPFMALVYRIPNSASPHEVEPTEPRDTLHHGAVILTPTFVFTVSSIYHPLPSKMAPEVTWPYLVVAGIINASQSGTFNDSAQVREIALTKYYEKEDEDVKVNYKWILIKVKEPFNFTTPEVSFIRILGIVMSYLDNDFREPCQALHWEARENGGEVHLIATRFYAWSWQMCASRETAQYMSLCIPRFAFKWICLADPREVFIICQRALAGVYERFSSHSQKCEDANKATSLDEVKPARILTAWHDSGVMSSMMCEFPDSMTEEDYVRFNLVDISRSKKQNAARRRRYSMLLLCTVVSGAMFSCRREQN